MKKQQVAIAVLMACVLGVTAGTCTHSGCGNNQGGDSNSHWAFNFSHTRYKMCTGTGHAYHTQGLTICTCTWPQRSWDCSNPE